ncbi:hypothetical protein BC941DRAFT_431681 [Chlamydoabsidia padenii]|nr:hypothetical protein BC941DRAFT_431681 [Chlamydoabsidia padenii]
MAQAEQPIITTQDSDKAQLGLELEQKKGNERGGKLQQTKETGLACNRSEKQECINMKRQGTPGHDHFEKLSNLTDDTIQQHADPKKPQQHNHHTKDDQGSCDRHNSDSEYEDATSNFGTGVELEEGELDTSDEEIVDCSNNIPRKAMTGPSITTSYQHYKPRQRTGAYPVRSHVNNMHQSSSHPTLHYVEMRPSPIQPNSYTYLRYTALHPPLLPSFFVQRPPYHVLPMYNNFRYQPYPRPPPITYQRYHSRSTPRHHHHPTTSSSRQSTYKRH